MEKVDELKLEGIMELIRFFESHYDPSIPKAADIHVQGTKGPIVIIMQYENYEPKRKRKNS